MPTCEALTVSVSIERNWRDVYDFASDPENIARWAAGLASGLRRSGDDWVGDGGPLGQVRVRFSPPNAFGVLDHTVFVGDAEGMENPIRVVPNGTGSEVCFTLFRRPGMDAKQFAEDEAAVRRDLDTLKTLLEG